MGRDRRDSSTNSDRSSSSQENSHPRDRMENTKNQQAPQGAVADDQAARRRGGGGGTRITKPERVDSQPHLPKFGAKSISYGMRQGVQERTREYYPTREPSLLPICQEGGKGAVMEATL